MPLDPPSVLAVRLRRTLVRPVARRSIAVAVAAITGLTVATQARAADAARSRWSDTRSVAVARHDLRPGDRLEADDAEVRELPAGAVAEVALAEPPVGAVVRQPIAAGEPLVAARLAPAGLTGVAALLPEGHRAVSIAVGPLGVPPVAIGDTVDVVAVIPTEADVHGHGGDLGLDGDGDGDGDGDDTTEAGGDVARRPAVPAVPLVERAPVLDVTDQAVTVAVSEADAPAVVYAATQGALTLTLAGA